MKNIDETEGPARKRNVPITEGLPSKYSYSTDSKKKNSDKVLFLWAGGEGSGLFFTQSIKK